MRIFIFGLIAGYVLCEIINYWRKTRHRSEDETSSCCNETPSCLTENEMQSCLTGEDK